MDRIQTFIGQEIYEWSHSSPDRNTMVALAKLCSAIFGANGMANGLACTQTTVASMQVSIGQGELYQVASLEASTSGTLPVDTTNTILKQGILLGSAAPVNLPASSTFAAPGTAGQSINYLIEAQYQDQDVSLDPTTGASPVVLNFFNSANPAIPWSGPGNAGTSSNTFRKGIIAWQVKAGTAATTGTQTTPSPDSGWIGLWVVTVANGQVTITSTSIAAYAGAPFLPTAGIVVGGLQGSVCTVSQAGGTADAIIGSYKPSITALTDGMTLYVRAVNANATTTPTFTPASGVITPRTIVKGNGLALAPGDIAGAGHWIELQYDLTLDKMVLLNPASGVRVIGNSAQVTGLVGTNNAGTPNSQMDFSAAAVNLRDPVSGAAYSKTNVATGTVNLLTAGPAVDARDTAGVIAASTWVHFYYIYNPTTDTIARIASASAPPTGPALPAGYTAWAYAFSDYYNASSILARVFVRGAWVRYRTSLAAVAAGTATTTTAVSLVSIIPPNALEFTLQVTQVGVTSTAGGAYAYTLVIETDAGAGTAQIGAQGSGTASTATYQSGTVPPMPNIGQSFNYYNNVGSGTLPTASINVNGFKVPNGGE